MIMRKLKKKLLIKKLKRNNLLFQFTGTRLRYRQQNIVAQTKIFIIYKQIFVVLPFKTIREMMPLVYQLTS